MTTDDSPARQGGGEDKKAIFVGEEDIAGRTTPKKDLVSAVFLTALSLVAMVYAWQLDVPASIYTAPGLLPFLTGFSLLIMAFGLGLKALRRGAADGFFDGTGSLVSGYWAEQENRRALLLIAIIFAWVVIVGQVSLDLRWPTPIHEFRFSGYEAVSIPMLILILRLFWQASWARCSLVSIVVVVAVASAFRDGFKILLPEAG